jgi:large subunit ribosomal protein L24
MAARIRKGDKVIVIAGDAKGRQGEVLRVLPKDNRAVVQGVAIAKLHTKPKGVQQPGGIIEREAAIHLSNLSLIDPDSGKATRIGFRKLDDGSKIRFARKSGKTIEA